MSLLHGCPQLAIGPSVLLLFILGTVWPNTLCPHPLCLFSEVASRLPSSGVPSRDFYCSFCSTCAVTVGVLCYCVLMETEATWDCVEDDTKSVGLCCEDARDNDDFKLRNGSSM